MGQAFDAVGDMLSDPVLGASKREVFEQLEKRHPDAHEFRIQSGAPMPLAEKIDHLFSYHKPEGTQPEQYEAIRAKAKEFAGVLVANTTAGADQSAAIRKLRECVMTANASIALKGVA